LTNSPLWVFVIWVITTVTALSIIYEATAGRHPLRITVHRFTDGMHLPVFVRAAVLGWIFVFGHIFWGFC
jgi:hypothetical protein